MFAMRSLPALKQWLAAVLPVSLLVTLFPVAAAASFTITTVSLPGGVDGTAYSQQLTSSGGTGAVTWKLGSEGSLVSGLSLSSSGLVSGTPTGSTNGPGNFTVVATDSASNVATAEIPYIINPENGSFKVTTTSLPNGLQNQAYSFQLSSTGGTGTVAWKLTTGNGGNGLPPGLSLAPNGEISGTPPNLGTFN